MERIFEKLYYSMEIGENKEGGSIIASARSRGTFALNPVAVGGREYFIRNKDQRCYVIS